MGSTRFRNPRALSSALAALRTLHPRALGFPIFGASVSEPHIDVDEFAVNFLYHRVGRLCM